MRTAIVTGGTRKDVSAMGVLALNIRDIAPKLADELIIFHDGIPEKQQKIIESIFPTKFYKYQFDIGFRDLRANRSLRYFSEMVFCKYECFRLLDEYDCVIWTDYDVIIKKNLYELLDYNLGLQIVTADTPLKRMFLETINNIDMSAYDLSQMSIATPLFVLTRNIGDYGKYYKWCIDKTKQYARYMYLPEQCIITMLIQFYHIQFKELSPRKYAQHPRDDDGNAYIIHAYGRPKFWEGLQNSVWEQYYKTWLEMGGSQYKKPLKESIIQVKVDMLKLIGIEPTY